MSSEAVVFSLPRLWIDACKYHYEKLPLMLSHQKKHQLVAMVEQSQSVVNNGKQTAFYLGDL